MLRTIFFISLTVLTSASLIAQTTPAPPTPVPRATAKPAAKPSVLTVQVTDTLGAPLAETAIAVTGPVSRDGVSAADGSVRFMSMRPGNYRLRFTREGMTTLERDVTLRAGESLVVEAALTPAPALPAPPAPAPAPVANSSAKLGPPVDPRVTPVPLFLEKNFIGGREGRKDSLLGCTGTGTATLHQLRDSWVAHTHDDAEEWIYIVAGEGTLRIGTQDQKVQAGTFSLVPHTVTHAVIPQGRNPLILISVLSGPACNQ